ncbi:TetR family transcriptional regulator [Aeromicrobium sp. CTD01-1L150]|uniref:TetR/AcrR family transcriptional regulator n=1 Tax=Aeromicrobium sp. CTD01-1L150 TaxID=3341830 RepID=UPI0035BF6DA2
MHTVQDGDPTAASRIRETAIDLFGRDGFDVGLRTIADEAGVSLGLIRHHFGAKHQLRAACDEHVLQLIDNLQAERVEVAEPGKHLLEQLAGLDELAPLVQYMVRALTAGGPTARAFLDRIVASTETHLDHGVETGTIKPSVDARARARYLAVTGLGGMLLDYALSDEDDAVTAWRAYTERVTLPTLELYTQGLLTDREMLDTYLLYLKDPPGGDPDVPGP